MLDRVRTADFGFPTEGLAAARLPAAAGPKREADFSIRRVRDNLQQASGVRSVAVAEGMPIDFDYRLFRVARTEWSEVCHGARHARGRKLSRDHRRAAAARSNDHGRGPHHGGARRGDFRTARRAALSGHGADWRTRDGHAGRRPRAGVHDCGRECGFRHVTIDHRATADPAAAARRVHRPPWRRSARAKAAEDGLPSRCISSRAARRATNQS